MSMRNTISNGGRGGGALGGRTRLRRDGRLLKAAAALVVVAMLYLAVSSRLVSSSPSKAAEVSGRRASRGIPIEAPVTKGLSEEEKTVVRTTATVKALPKSTTVAEPLSTAAEVTSLVAAVATSPNAAPFAALPGNSEASCWCPRGSDTAASANARWAAAVVWDIKDSANNGPNHRPLIRRPAASPLSLAQAGSEETTREGSLPALPPLSADALAEVAAAEARGDAVSLHSHRGPCDTLSRQMREYSLDHGSVRGHAFLRGHFETCSLDTKSPSSAAPFAGQRDVRGDMVPSCAERSVLAAVETADYWDAAQPHTVVPSVAAALLASSRREACACEDSAGGFIVNAAPHEPVLAQLAAAADALSDSCGAGGCSDKAILAHVEAAVPTTSPLASSGAEGKDLAIPRPPTTFNLADRSAAAHPSRDALCLAASQTMATYPTIELLPSEEEADNSDDDAATASASPLRFPSFDAAALRSYSPLRSLSRLAAAPRNASWPSEWHTFANCADNCDVTTLNLKALGLSQEEERRRVAIEDALLAGIDFAALSSNKAISLEAVQSAIAAVPSVTAEDLRWYGRRVALGLLTTSSAAAPQTLLLPSAGSGGKALAAQQAIFASEGLSVPTPLLRQDGAERGVLSKLVAKIAHKRRVASSYRRVLQQQQQEEGSAQQVEEAVGPAAGAEATTATEEQPINAGGAIHQSAEGVTEVAAAAAEAEAPPPTLAAAPRAVRLAPLQLAAIAGALQLGESAADPTLATAVLGPFDAPSTAGRSPAPPLLPKELAAYARDPLKYRNSANSHMRRDEAAVDFCLARHPKPTARKATGGPRSLPSLRRSLLVNTINGAPLVCYEGNDVVCYAVKSSGVWESHLHTLLRATVLRIRGEVRLAATILKEREAVLLEAAASSSSANDANAADDMDGAKKTLSPMTIKLYAEAAPGRGGPLEAWHPRAFVFEKSVGASTLSMEAADAALPALHRTAGQIAAVAATEISPEAAGGVGVAFDRFGYFLRPTADMPPATLLRQSATPPSASSLTRIPAPQLPHFAGVGGTAAGAGGGSEMAKSFASLWASTAYAVHKAHAYTVAPEAMPELFDRRVDVEFATEDAMSTLRHLAAMPAVVPNPNADAAAEGTAEYPSIPHLLMPAPSAGAAPRVRASDRNAFDEDVLFMDAGANVGSFAFDIRIGGSTAPQPSDAFRPFDDAMRVHGAGVLDGAAVTNFMLLEALPANVFVLEATRCLNTVRERSTWRRAVAKVTGLFDGLRCGGSCKTTASASFFPPVADWAEIPAQVTSEAFHAEVVVTTSIGEGTSEEAARTEHHERLRAYLSVFANCTAGPSEPSAAAAADATAFATRIVCTPPTWEPTLHHVALGDRDSEGAEAWCVLTSDFGNLADTLLTCDPAEVAQARALAKRLGAQGVPIGHPDAFSVIPPNEQIRGRLLPSSFVQLKTLDAVVRERERSAAVAPSSAAATSNLPDYARIAIDTLLKPRGVPPSLLNHAMARRFAKLIAEFAASAPEAPPALAAAGIVRPSRATSTGDLLAFVCVQKPFLKMDVEGFEPFVLKGLSKTIANPATRPLVVLTEAWRSDELVRQCTRMITEFNYIGVTVELESWGHGKSRMHVLSTVDDVQALNNKLLGTDMNTIVWVQKGYEDFMPQIAASQRASLG